MEKVAHEKSKVKKPEPEVVKAEPATSAFPADARINAYYYLHFKKAWLEDLGWQCNIALKIERNADGSVTLRKA